MFSSNVTLPTQVLPHELTMPAVDQAGFASVTKNQFISFFQGKGFRCAEDAQQQLKATYSKLTVRLAMSDPQVASDQGHAIYYLSIAPLNKRYKIVVGSACSNIAQQRKRVSGKFFQLRSLLPGYSKQVRQTAVLQEHRSASAIAYTLLENIPSKSATFMQSTTTFYSLEELLGTIFPKTTSFTGARALNSFFSFMFFIVCKARKQLQKNGSMEI